MATVTEILDRGSKATGLRSTGAERTVALQALQNAYRRAVADAEAALSLASYTFVASSDDYSLSTLCSEQPIRIYHVSVASQGADLPVQQVSFQELLDARDTSDTVGTPFYYATVSGRRGEDLVPR